MTKTRKRAGTCGAGADRSGHRREDPCAPGLVSAGQDVAWQVPPQRVLERMQAFGERPQQRRYDPVEGLPGLGG
ncbi:hypothetical protein [Methylococcus capsulatus]|uniref:hypothetical protein n=1 Tax=Methylococcus capsulatus TaxID=414 RepID=UPI0012B5950B|nr:hypothetical protein [Methylococcus capsulatus]